MAPTDTNANQFAPPDEGAELPLELDHSLLNTLRLHIDDALQKGTFEIPPLPKVAIELNTICQSATGDMGQAVKTIERDPQTAARVLRIASSVAYGATPTKGASKGATDLRRATVRIGLNGLRDIAFALTMGQVFRCGPLNPVLSQLTRHSFVVGCGTAWIIQKVRMDFSLAFLCGLLHDVGKNVILTIIAERGKRDPRWLDQRLVDQGLREFHTRVGAAVVKKWDLDPLIQEVVGLHHAPTQSKVAQAYTFAVALSNGADHLPEKEVDPLAAQFGTLKLVQRSGFANTFHRGLAEIIINARADSHLLVLTDNKQF